MGSCTATKQSLYNIGEAKTRNFSGARSMRSSTSSVEIRKLESVDQRKRRMDGEDNQYERIWNGSYGIGLKDYHQSPNSSETTGEQEYYRNQSKPHSALPSEKAKNSLYVSKNGKNYQSSFQALKA